MMGWKNFTYTLQRLLKCKLQIRKICGTDAALTTALKITICKDFCKPAPFCKNAKKGADWCYFFYSIAKARYAILYYKFDSLLRIVLWKSSVAKILRGGLIGDYEARKFPWLSEKVTILLTNSLFTTLLIQTQTINFRGLWIFSFGLLYQKQIKILQYLWFFKNNIGDIFLFLEK